jgi:hypothetical protein
VDPFLPWFCNVKIGGYYLTGVFPSGVVFAGKKQPQKTNIAIFMIHNRKCTHGQLDKAAKKGTKRQEKATNASQ